MNSFINQVNYEYVKNIRDQLGPFEYKPPDNAKRIKRSIVILDNGAEYDGEWDENGLKSGFGCEVKVDGSIYEG